MCSKLLSFTISKLSGVKSFSSARPFIFIFSYSVTSLSCYSASVRHEKIEEELLSELLIGFNSSEASSSGTEGEERGGRGVG